MTTGKALCRLQTALPLALAVLCASCPSPPPPPVASTPEPRFEIPDASGNPAAWFDAMGNLHTACAIYENASAGDLMLTDHSEFVVRDAALQNVARLDPEAGVRGRFYLKGTLVQNPSLAEPQVPALKIRDAAGETQAYLDQNGNLALRGQHVPSVD